MLYSVRTHKLETELVGLAQMALMFALGAAAAATVSLLFDTLLTGRSKSAMWTPEP